MSSESRGASVKAPMSSGRTHDHPLPSCHSITSASLLSASSSASQWPAHPRACLATARYASSLPVSQIRYISQPYVHLVLLLFSTQPVSPRPIFSLRFCRETDRPASAMVSSSRQQASQTLPRVILPFCRHFLRLPHPALVVQSGGGSDGRLPAATALARYRVQRETFGAE